MLSTLCVTSKAVVIATFITEEPVSRRMLVVELHVPNLDNVQRKNK